jgi:hypothetical protein
MTRISLKLHPGYCAGGRYDKLFPPFSVIQPELTGERCIA